MEKTYKREVAIAIMAALFGFAAYGVATGNAVAVDIFREGILPVSLIVMGAFGMDAVAKQINASKTR